MNPIRIYAVFLRQVFLLRDNWTRVTNIFVWLTVDMLLWGFITRYLDTVSRSGFSFIPVLLGAIILWDFLVRVQQGVSIALFEDIWSQNFLNFFASPLSITEYAGGLILTSITTTTAGFGFMLLLAGLLFGYNILLLGLNLLLFLAVLFIFGLALGIFICAIVLRLGPAAEWIAWPLPFFISPFVGVFYPISTLPAPLQHFAKILPPAYVFEGMRKVLAGEALPLLDFALGLGLAALYLLLAYLFFCYIYRLVIRSGLITRFSAEGGA